MAAMVVLALLCCLLLGTIIYFINLKEKGNWPSKRLKQKKPNFIPLKVNRKKLANLQLVSLSSQFRPHFILNALNTIGAQMDDKPEAESVLSRLGESVNIILTMPGSKNITQF
ncbi:MAG: histidine kinase [Chitinophagaceae bacterium]|nr:histidine kinase [Chitinophagaceae bacterium]